MKNLLLIAVASVLATSVFAQETVKKVRVYKGKAVVYERNYNDVDSIVFVDVPAGMLSGEFSVSATKKVHFSKGNLQAAYIGGKWTWSFAENQWDYVGGAAANNAINGNGTVSTNGIVDLFGWSTAATYYGINNSTNTNDYSGDFEDWGKTIGEGWHTLSRAEWLYLFHERDKADELFGLGSVNGINGTIILPDEWILPDGTIFNKAKDNNLVWQDSHYYNSDGNNFSHNTYTAEQWDTMERAGAVFLPTAGYRVGTEVVYVSNGYYWSSTPYGKNAYNLALSLYRTSPQNSSIWYSGLSVRLVR